MATTKETGHAKNVANYEKFIDACKSFGESYNPSRADLQVDGMNAQLTSAQTAMDELKQAERTYGRTTNDRELLFGLLTTFATRIIGALESCGANALTIEDARAINNKLNGKRATPLPKVDPKETAEGENEPRTRSTSQRSFDNQVDHFKKLITAVSAEPKYKPNEVELKVPSLYATLSDLQVKNKLAAQAEQALSNARTKRDRLLYAPGTGICDIVNAVKAYAVSAYRPTSKEYKNLTKFRFVRIVANK